MRYALVTFGCRVNQADSLAIEEGLRRRGAAAADPETADLVVVNTCSVTATADQGARQTIRRIARSNPGARIVVTGCYATRSPEEVRALPNVLHVVPNPDKGDIAALASAGRWHDAGEWHDAAEWHGTAEWHDIGQGHGTGEWFGAGGGPCGASIVPGVAGRTAFTLRVQTGCAEPCSYCIIPATRGAPVSLDPTAVLSAVARAAAAGFKEVVLTGVHLGSYGRDLEPRTSLAALLGKLGRARPAVAPDVLFRVSSLEPMDCTPEVVAIVAGVPGFAPHFHLPLQHASNRVLAAMRRPYTLEQYAQLVAGIRLRLPHAAIGADVIVGFPGETDDDFARLAEWLDDSPLTHVHVFPYSDRPGTFASSLEGRPPGHVVRERSRIIRELSARLSASFRQSQCGTVQRALTLDDGTVAVTGNYLKVRLAAGRGRNEWVDVRIEEVGGGLVGLTS